MCGLMIAILTSLVSFWTLTVTASAPLDGIGVEAKPQLENGGRETNGDAKGESKRPQGEFTFGPLAPYNVHFAWHNRSPSCSNVHNSMLCVAYGPVDIDLMHEGALDVYRLEDDEHAICYLGRLGSFCDVYEAHGE